MKWTLKSKVDYQNMENLSLKDKIILWFLNFLLMILPDKLKIRLIKDLHDEGIL